MKKCFVPNKMLLVLEILRTGLLSVIQSNTICNSLLMTEVISLTVGADMYSAESSAYIAIQAFVQASGRSFVNTEKSRCPSDEPWGTLHDRYLVCEKLPLKKTFCVLLIR